MQNPQAVPQAVPDLAVLIVDPSDAPRRPHLWSCVVTRTGNHVVLYPFASSGHPHTREHEACALRDALAHYDRQGLRDHITQCIFIGPEDGLKDILGIEWPAVRSVQGTTLPSDYGHPDGWTQAVIKRYANC